MLAALAPAIAAAAEPDGGLDITLPPGFAATIVLDGLADPATMAFAPDGRLFIGERIQGRLRVAVPSEDGTWTLHAEPFHVFDVPQDADGNPDRHRSSGVRGFAFAPDFLASGEITLFCMRHDPRHNALWRITASPDDANQSTGTADLLLSMPFNGSESSGSHNGGAVTFGSDGLLYVTTGDGWNGGDDVQSLETWTGKVLRLEGDGSIPADNAFVDEASGDFRAIHALGLRNPFACTVEPTTGSVIVHDVRGSDKASLERVVAGANYGHDGYDGIGTPADSWANVGLGGGPGRIVTGGDWAGPCSTFGPEYAGDLFVGLWGSNGTNRGSIARLIPDPDGGPSVVLPFATDVAHDDPEGPLRPVAARFGPDGRLYVLLSGYEAENGRVVAIAPTTPPSGIADIDGDGTVGLSDLLIVLSAWGPCGAGDPCLADIDDDGLVGIGDLLTVLARWGTCG